VTLILTLHSKFRITKEGPSRFCPFCLLQLSKSDKEDLTEKRFNLSALRAWSPTLGPSTLHQAVFLETYVSLHKQTLIRRVKIQDCKI